MRGLAMIEDERMGGGKKVIRNRKGSSEGLAAKWTWFLAGLEEQGGEILAGHSLCDLSDFDAAVQIEMW